jgi:hypothetical protein
MPRKAILEDDSYVAHLRIRREHEEEDEKVADSRLQGWIRVRSGQSSCAAGLDPHRPRLDAVALNKGEELGP